jgi:hypothetical protein
MGTKVFPGSLSKPNDLLTEQPTIGLGIQSEKGNSIRF